MFARPAKLRAHPCLSALALVAVGASLAAGQSTSTEPSNEIPRVVMPDIPEARPRYPRNIYFPSVPPALHQPVRWKSSPTPIPHTEPAATLARCINEPFYPQLASRVRLKRFNHRHYRDLTAYLSEKTALQQAIRAELARTEKLDPAARVAALQQLARTQAAPLAALAARAERFRHDFVLEDGGWNAFRKWHLGDGSRRGDNPAETASVLTASAYFQEGISADQRDLLRIVALDISNSVAPELADVAAGDPIYLQFLPAPARLAVPSNLPAELATKISDFESRFAALKQELYQAIHAQDKRLAFIRHAALSSLAEKQAPQFRALEGLAEEIRRGLHALPASDATPNDSPLPPELDQRVVRLVHGRRELTENAQRKIAAINARLAHRLIAFSRVEGPKLVCWVVDQRRAGDRPEAKIEAQLSTLDADLSAIAQEFGQTYAALSQEGLALQRDIAQLPAFSAAGAANLALAKATRAALLREAHAVYDDYRIAVLVPGLSPAQRRLMFDAAVVRLDLPPPEAQLQPDRREN